MAALSPLEYRFIKTGLTYLEDPQGTWCPHYIQGKMNNDERLIGSTLTSFEQVFKTTLSLVKKQYALKNWEDRYRFNWPMVEPIFKSLNK